MSDDQITSVQDIVEELELIQMQSTGELSVGSPVFRLGPNIDTGILAAWTHVSFLRKRTNIGNIDQMGQLKDLKDDEYVWVIFDKPGETIQFTHDLTECAMYLWQRIVQLEDRELDWIQ